MQVVHQEVTCPSGKVRYLSWNHAAKDAAAMRRKGKRRDAHPYHCRVCSGCHVGGAV